MDGKNLPASPEWLNSEPIPFNLFPDVGVDRANGVLRGYVVAQTGIFKNAWRGEFDEEGLSAIVDLINAKPQGLKSRFTHPTMSSDGLGTFLGRSRNARLDKTINAEGKETLAVRADLHFDKTAFKPTVSGGTPYASYIMDLAESDPDAISSSVVVEKEDKFRINEDGTPKKGARGEDLPPLWKVKRIHASDIVDTGDAVDGLLSSNAPERMFAARGTELLDRIFSGQSPEVIESRCTSFLNKYLQLRTSKAITNPSHGDETMPDEPKEKAENAAMQKQLDLLKSQLEQLTGQTKVLEEERNHYKSEATTLAGAVKDLQTKNDRQEVTALLNGSDYLDKYTQDELPGIVELALSLKADTVQLSTGKSRYETYLDSIKNRQVKVNLRAVGGHLPNTTSTGGPHTPSQAINQFAAENDIDVLKDKASFDKAEDGARKKYPAVFGIKEGVR